MTTLEQALAHAYETRWKHGRDGGKCDYSQAKIAAWACVHALGIPNAPLPPGRSWLGLVPISEATEGVLRQVISKWYVEGVAPATINKRLNCLSVMGVAVQGCRQKVKPALKWWLTPEAEEAAVMFLRGGDADDLVLADLIQWTTKTGLRIEESLRLRRQDFTQDFAEVSVPGLKTATSQATLPLGAIPRSIASAQFAVASDLGTALMFVTGYETLRKRWDLLRAAMQWTGNGVTLKALRRSAARYLHVDCGMPIDMVRSYLRHEDIETTMGYLRLTGGYGTEEMRRYLK